MPGDIVTKKRIVILGARSVGKSSLIIQFIENHFVESYHPTIECKFSKSVNYQGVEYECDIVDTAGQDEYSILNSNHVIGTHGYVLVYSVTSQSSFDMVNIIYDKISVLEGYSSFPCVIVGSKMDLETHRQVDPLVAKESADRCGAAWVETSAKTNTNVAKVFELCVEEILKNIQKQTFSNGTPPDSSYLNKCLVM